MSTRSPAPDDLRRVRVHAWLSFALLLVPAHARAQSTAVTVTTAPDGARVTEWHPLAPGQGRLRVAVNRPNTDVHVDGVLVGDAPLERDLAPGRHRVRVTSPGQKAWEGDVAITAGELAPLNVQLRPSPSVAGAWTTLGLAALVEGGAVAAGVVSNVEHASLDASRAAGTLDNRDPRIDAGTALAVTADVGFALGAVVAGVAIYLFAHDATPPSSARAAPHERVPEAPP